MMRRKKREWNNRIVMILFMLTVCVFSLMDVMQITAAGQRQLVMVKDDFRAGIVQDLGFLQNNRPKQKTTEISAESVSGNTVSENDVSTPYEVCAQEDIIVADQAADLAGARAALIAGWERLDSEVILEDYHIQNDDYKAFFQDTLNQNPQLFYVKGGGSHSYDEATGEVVGVYPSYRYPTDQIAGKKKEFDDAVKEALSGVNASWSDLEKALYLNDYLVKTTAYDETYTKGTPYDTLVGRCSVCNGYALAYKYLLNKSGVACEMVTSDKAEHAWNMVKMAGSYYHVDVTWNDPIPDKIGRVQHKQFAKSTYAFKNDAGLKDHYVANDWVLSGGFSESYASSKNFDSFFWDTVNTSMMYAEGYWYVTDTTGTIKKYQCSNAGKTWKVIDTIYDGAEFWLAAGGGGYYPKRYTVLEYDPAKKILYYTLPNSVHAYNVTTGSDTEVYAMDETAKKSGSIYGMTIENGTVKVLVAKGPNETGSVKTAFTLSKVNAGKTEKPDDPSPDDESETGAIIRPAQTRLTKATGKKKSIYVKWKKKTVNVNGYQIQYSTSKKFTKKTTKTVTVKSAKTSSKTIKKLKSKKKYYVRIRTYRNAKVNGKTKKVYSAWSKSKKVTTK